MINKIVFSIPVLLHLNRFSKLPLEIDEINEDTKCMVIIATPQITQFMDIK